MVATNIPLDASPNETLIADELLISALREEPRAWARPIIAILVSPFLYAYVSHLSAGVWLAVILAFEAFGFLLRRRIIAGEGWRAWAIQANIFAISLCWVAHAVLLWRVGGVIPSVAAVMDLFSVALYAAIGCYQSLRLFLLLVLPQLGALAALLISYLVQNAPPLVAIAASLATVGACATVLMNGLSMYSAEARLRRSNQELASLARSARAASQAKSDFLATVSHEIRTPLNGVLGLVQAMAHDELPERQRERLTLVGESGELLLTILNDILDLAKIEAGMLELQQDPFDLGALALLAQKTFADVAKSKCLGFRLEIEQGARGIYRGDPTRVRQVLYNLISNALKFTPSGTVEVHIGLAETGLRFVVADTGVGIGPDEIEPMFDRFVQADSARPFDGTGLGLSICRELCRAMGGDVTVTSELGKGSCFTVDLPLERMGDSRRDDHQVEGGATPVFAGAGLRIMAAEDNHTNQLVLYALLSQTGIDLKVVGNGAEAVAEWESGEWDVILMDVRMPVMDGIAAARQIRRREAETERPATPIIALTANAMDHQLDAYVAAGMTDFVAKPIDVGRLYEAIARVRT